MNPSLPPPPAPTAAEIQSIRNEFDEAFYREQTPHFDFPQADPVVHFAVKGWREGRDPAPWFSVQAYLARHEDVRAEGLNPFLHYLLFGQKEGRQIHASTHCKGVAVSRAPNATDANRSCGMSGHIDALTSAGVLEGWALDSARPLDMLEVSVLDEKGDEVAVGMANLYRRDLAEAGLGFGWCAFRLSVSASVSQLKSSSLTLIDKKTGSRVHFARRIKYIERSETSLRNLEEIKNCDPTIVEDLSSIERCDRFFNDFILARGIDNFIRSSYIYVLGRAIDQEGLGIYRRLLRHNRLTPYALLRTLAESDEFRGKPRQLVAPNVRGFPFRLAM